MVAALTDFVDRAKSKGQIYAALYELKDEELISKLESIKSRLHLVLSNSVEKDLNPRDKRREPGSAGSFDRDGQGDLESNYAAEPHRAQQVSCLCGRKRQSESRTLWVNELDVDGPVCADEQHSRD